MESAGQPGTSMEVPSLPQAPPGLPQDTPPPAPAAAPAIPAPLADPNTSSMPAPAESQAYLPAPLHHLDPSMSMSAAGLYGPSTAIPTVQISPMVSVPNVGAPYPPLQTTQQLGAMGRPDLMASSPLAATGMHPSVPAGMSMSPGAVGAGQPGLPMEGGGDVDPSLPPTKGPNVRKRGRPPIKTDAAERTNSVQEKNRQAQARFRQRQKEKMEEYDRQVRELQTDNMRLAEEKQSLVAQKAVLDQMLHTKDEELRSFKSSRVDVGEAARGNLPTTSAAFMADGAHTLCSMQASQMVAAAAAGEQLIRAWKDTVKALSELQMKLEAHMENAHVLQEIDRLMTDTASVCWKAAQEDPEAAKVLLSMHYRDSEAGVVVRPEHWQNVVHQLSLSPEQHATFMSLAGKYRDDVARCACTRQDLLGTLAKTGPDAHCSNRQCAHSIQAFGAAFKLVEALRAEDRAHLDHVVTVLDRVFTKQQLARASVASYPLFPDVCEMGRVLEQLQVSAPAATGNVMQLGSAL